MRVHCTLNAADVAEEAGVASGENLIVFFNHLRGRR
jgi:hypothetical protein